MIIETQMKHSILDLQRERIEKWRTEWVDGVPISPMPSSFAYPGTYTMSVPKGKIKYVVNDCAVWYGDTWLTPGQMHRFYIEIKYPKGARRLSGVQQAEFSANLGHPPQYCIPGKVPWGYHVDLRSAYWQIVRAFGWDVSYSPGKYIVVGSDCNDFPFPDNKPARNGLVTTAKGTDLWVWTGKEYRYQTAPPRTTNKALYRLTMDVLNAVALEMKDRAAALYVNVDGYIIPAERLAAARTIFSEWGIDWRYQYPIAASYDDPDPLPMTIYHVSDYSNPLKSPHPSHRHYDQAKDKIARLDVGWLKERFRAFSDYHQGKTSVSPNYREG